MPSSKVPPYGSGGALYLRPLLFGSGPRIGLQPAEEYTFLIMVVPVGTSILVSAFHFHLLPILNFISHHKGIIIRVDLPNQSPDSSSKNMIVPHRGASGLPKLPVIMPLT
jgi:hypothetical protein